MEGHPIPLPRAPWAAPAHESRGEALAHEHEALAEVTAHEFHDHPEPAVPHEEHDDTLRAGC